MPIKPVGWICGQVLKNFSGRIEGLQKVIMDLVDEFKDDFPTILKSSQSNQKREPLRKTSKVRMAFALAKINQGTLIQGLNTISSSSKSVAKLLEPQLACRLFELRKISHRLLREVNTLKQPLYNMRTVCVNTVLEKIKKILQEEELIRQNRDESENLRKAFSEPVLSKSMIPEGEIKAKPYRSLPEMPEDISGSPKLPAKLNNKIQVLHSVFD
ncbi:spermatogenesis-associated protein 9 isoform X4 [Talpa occidentalis]|uniref:spermatogenesis-associated protein 9 isoform X4 n=1 Tax=Talpa occidentalis TaxID=50954 RepID=UPI00188DDF18|nr:spermatogenesis-associated protein 9 isoform X4 [Talpa occidentalis]